MGDKQSCKVCGGKGGWKVNTNHWSENNWNDCPFCEGYGFHDKLNDDESDKSILLAYNQYKHIIARIMGGFCNLLSYVTTDKCRRIEISILPTDKDKLTLMEFAKQLMRFGHYHSRLGVEICQIFRYDSKTEKFNYHWRLVLTPVEMKDLDGFIDFLRVWDMNGKLKKGQ